MGKGVMILSEVGQGSSFWADNRTEWDIKRQAFEDLEQERH